MFVGGLVVPETRNRCWWFRELGTSKRPTSHRRVRMSEPHARKPRRDTVLTRLADLPVPKETPAEERDRRLSEHNAARATREGRKAEAKKQRVGRATERKRRELNRHVTITWLDPPVD